MDLLDLNNCGPTFYKDYRYVLVVVNFSLNLGGQFPRKVKLKRTKDSFENINKTLNGKSKLIVTDVRKEFLIKIFTRFLNKMKLKDLIDFFPNVGFSLRDLTKLSVIFLKNLFFLKK